MTGLKSSWTVNAGKRTDGLRLKKPLHTQNILNISQCLEILKLP